MFGLSVKNVREALPRGIALLLRKGMVEPSRNGDVITYPGPVATVYRYPKQHVLLNPYRDANPFFHLIEAMWMLEGREDGGPLDMYIKGFSSRYGVSGIIPDAYGYRWRSYFEVDQIQDIIDKLKVDPNTRQAVLQMWDSEDFSTPPEIAKPCNLCAVFRIRLGRLDMTVYNRSNDIIFGTYGANAVHFALLQEYIASMVGVPMGEYTQVSNDYHMYMDVWEMIKERIGADDYTHSDTVALSLSTQDMNYGEMLPLVGDPSTFDEDLSRLWEALDRLHVQGPPLFENDIFVSTRNPFLTTVFALAAAYAEHKTHNKVGREYHMNRVTAPDWKQAAEEWFNRRDRALKQKEVKHA
jgi:hypothetical protein